MRYHFNEFNCLTGMIGMFRIVGEAAVAAADSAAQRWAIALFAE